MKLNKANTQLGVTFNVVEFEPADILRLAQDSAQLTRIVECVNADRRQKVALVDGRADLSAAIGLNDLDGKAIDPPGLGFQRLTKTKTQGTESWLEWDETDNEHIKRFVDAVVKGQFTLHGFTLPSGDDKVKDTAVWTFLQTIADKQGDAVIIGGKVNGLDVVYTNDDGASLAIPDSTACYVLDLARAVRKGGTGPSIPKYALEAADKIIANGNEAKWHGHFTNGYTSASGVVIDPFPVGDFVTPHAPDATPEVKEAHHQAKRKALARGIHTARTQENEKTVRQEFA